MSGTSHWDLQCIYCFKPISFYAPHVTLGTRAAHMDCAGKATQTLPGKISELEREVERWKADSRLLHGALLLLHEAGITPSSTELIAAADRAAGGGE